MVFDSGCKRAINCGCAWSIRPPTVGTIARVAVETATQTIFVVMVVGGVVVRVGVGVRLPPIVVTIAMALAPSVVAMAVAMVNATHRSGF